MKVWNTVIDTIQAAMIFLVIVLVAVCIFVLIAFDSAVGTNAMLFLTNKNLQASLVISLATSGLLLALMFIGYTMHKNKIQSTPVLIGAGLVFVLDIYFDSLSADYLRFGQFVALSDLQGNVKLTQILFRALIGGLSLVGEALAIAIIMGMPVLKTVISDALPKSGKPQQEKGKPEQNKNKSPYKPKFRPDFRFPKQKPFHGNYEDKNEIPDFMDEILKKK